MEELFNPFQSDGTKRAHLKLFYQKLFRISVEYHSNTMIIND